MTDPTPQQGRHDGDAPPTPLAIRDFLTDGSLAALCAEITALSANPVWLRDANGLAILPGDEDQPWHIVDEADAAPIAFQNAGIPYDPDIPLSLAPVTISTGTLGWIVGYAPDGRDADRLKRAIDLLASSVRDVCEAQLALRHRINELDALYRLSTMVVEADDTTDLLNAALDIAIDVLHADAGTISVIQPGDDVPVVKAARGLDDGWIDAASRFCQPGAVGSPALKGEIVCSDLTGVADADCLKAGLRTLVCAGLIYRSRLLGAITLFSTSERTFDHNEQELLRSIAELAASSINDANLRRLHAEDARIQRQVRLAADVQRRMLPRELPDLPPLDIAARYAPSFELGGDFYDFLDLGGHLAIGVGDVVGKGVAAALLMSSVRAALRAHAQDVYDLAEVLARVNHALADDTLDNEFATLWYGVVNPQNLRLTYASAGHDPALLIRTTPDGVQVTDLASRNLVLGVDRDHKYTPGLAQLRRGDTLVVYTDGLPDVTNFDNQRLGKPRVREIITDVLTEQPDIDAAGIVEHLFWHVRQFAGLNKRPDDITLVVLRVGR